MPVTITPNLQAVTTVGAYTDKNISITRELASTDSPPGTLLIDALVNNSGDPGLYNVQHNLTLGYTGGAYTSIPTHYRSAVTFTNPNSSGTLNLYNADFSVNHNSIATLKNLQGVNSTIGMFGGGVATDAWSFRAGLASNGGTLSTHCDYTNSAIWGGTLTDYYFAKPVAPTGAGAITNFYGMYFPTWTRGTNNYPIWLEDVGGVFFRNSATKVHSSAAGQLDLTAATTVKINTAQLVLPNYSLPLADGTANQYLKTNGAGATSFDTLTLSDITDYTNNSSTTEMLFNNAGAIDGTSFFTTDGTNLDLTSGDFRLDDNVGLSLGTGDDARLYYDGTDLIIDSTVVGTGVVRLKADSSGDLILDRIGLGGSPITSLYWINYVKTTNTGRGALNFDYTYTGAGIQANVLSYPTYQGTSANPLCIAYQARVRDLSDPSGSGTYLGVDIGFGSPATLSITQGTKNFYGIRIQHNQGSGTANTGGTINKYGMQILAFAAYAGVAGEYETGIYSEEDIEVSPDVLVGFNAAVATKSTTYYIYNSATTDLDHFIDSTKVMTEDNDLVETFVPFKVAGVTLGTVVDTITTPATNDDPSEFTQQNRVATTDATVTTLDTYTIPATTTVVIVTRVVARRTGGVAGTAEDGAGYEFATTIKNVAGTATIIAGPTAVFTHESQAGWAATHDVNAATVRIRVTGAVNNNVTWHSTSKIYQVGS